MIEDLATNSKGNINEMLTYVVKNKNKETGWTNLGAEEEAKNTKLYNYLKLLENNNLIIRKERLYLKLKNGLIEEVIRK